MSTDTVNNVNRLLADAQPLIKFATSVDWVRVRNETEVDWDRGIVLRCESQLREILLRMNLAHSTTSGELAFSTNGRAFLGKVLIDLERTLKLGSPIAQRYPLEHILASGKNSITFKANDLRLGRSVVLKFFRPGRGEGIVANIAKVGRVKADPILVNPLDVLQYPVADGHNHTLFINTIVFPYIEGETLRAYLSRERNSSPVVIQAFIEQTCLVMLALHKEGLEHGDLHPNNVMVTTDSTGSAAFRIIDVSYGADKPSQYEYALTDIDAFKHILRLALADVQLRLTQISLRRLLGARLFTLVDYVLNSAASFEDVNRELHDGRAFAAFNERKADFCRKLFAPPRDFGILRYEEFNSPSIAMSLFCPYPQLFERLCEFGNTVLFGHRGTGKSTYMAAMNFFPQVSKSPVDFKENMGVLFACRQGEFRKFSHSYLKLVSRETKIRIKDVLVIKIIRKTLTTLAEAVRSNRIEAPTSLSAIADLIVTRLQSAPGVMSLHQLSELESITATVLQAEINLIDDIFTETGVRPQSRLLDEQALRAFFEAVRKTFKELRQTRFSVLFDDAGAPNIPREVQAVICDLMASTNELYCIKLSAEKKTFDFVTIDQKPIERIHDVRVYTISDYLNIGSGFDSEWRHLEEYFRELVGVRLKESGYTSSDIRHYLGSDGMCMDELVKRLACRGRGAPVYSGWRATWQIADRTMRHLIEMISAVFDDAKLKPSDPTRIIAAKVQSRQIVRFSNDKLRGLMFLPGTIQIGGKRRPLGKMLYEFAASFGKISHLYLQSSRANAKGEQRLRRFDERLAIEIDNTLDLSEDAQRVLSTLIQFAVIDDEKMVTAFDDNMRKPVYIFNRVYCPVLRISFRRADHWRLSSRRFERFLLEPTEFVRGDARLGKLLSGEADAGLFK